MSISNIKSPTYNSIHYAVLVDELRDYLEIVRSNTDQCGTYSQRCSEIPYVLVSSWKKLTLNGLDVWLTLLITFTVFTETVFNTVSFNLSFFPWLKSSIIISL